jgi:subtilisin family serine protease
MKKLNMKSALIFVTTALAASPALATRYMVVFKNKDVFQQTHVQLMMQQMPLSAVRIQQNGTVNRPFAQTQVEVQDSLQNLNTLVVDAQDEKAIEAFARNSSVAFVEKEVFHPAPKPVNGFRLTQAWDFSLAYSSFKRTGTPALGPKTPYGINLVRAPQAWAASNYGQGARVLILDTGIDKDHPALKDNFEKGRDFVGDNNQPYDLADHVGHGTHVAGTVAASFGADGFVGVAPKAKILMGRVCSEEGCSNIAVTSGINWGIQEKVDLVSMSLGGPFATAAEKRAVEAAEKAGVTIVAASGNDGQARVSYPAAFPTAIAVGAVDSASQKAQFSNWGPELDIVAPGVAVVSSVPMGSGRESKVLAGVSGQEEEVKSTSFVGSPDVAQPTANELVFAGFGKPENFNSRVTGKFALIQRGEINFADKVKNAIAAGAAGVVIYNNAPGLIQGAITQDGSTVAIPVVMIEQTVGESLKAALDAGQSARAVIQTLATDYAAFDGTSMATPHVAGVVALMKAAKKSLTPAQVRDALKATATALTPNDQNQMGAGLVNAEAVVNAVLH